MLDNVRVVVTVNHRELHLLVAARREALLRAVVVCHRRRLRILNRSLLECGLGLAAVGAPRRVEHYHPHSALLEHLQECGVRQLHNRPSLHVAARGLLLMPDAISVRDATPIVIDETLLAPARVHAVELGILAVLLPALLVERHLKLHLPQRPEVFCRADTCTRNGRIISTLFAC